MVVGYELLFAGTAFSVAYPDQIASVVGRAPIIFAGVVTSPLPDSIIPLLPPIGLALEVVFPLFVHQSLVTATDIQLHLS